MRSGSDRSPNDPGSHSRRSFRSPTRLMRRMPSLAARYPSLVGPGSRPRRDVHPRRDHGDRQRRTAGSTQVTEIRRIDPTVLRRRARVDFGGMTTIRPALDAALRHTIALRTEALFRSSGAFREGHFLLKSGRHGDAYVEKFQVLQDPAATSELCGFFATHGRGLRRRAAGRPRRRPDDRRRHPRLRDGAPARRPEHLRRGGPRRRRRDPARVPARLPDRAGRARPARRRHPDDRRLAAGDAAGRRGDGRRDRRVRRPRRPERRPDDPHLADDRATSIRCGRSGSWTCRPTSPAPRPARAAPTGRRSTRRAAPARARSGPARPRS